MRLKCAFIIILAFALSCTETKPDVINSVNIIKKLTEDLQSLPSGYVFHHHSDSVYPGGYGADIDHGKAKIAGQLGMAKIAELNSHGKTGSYRVAGGYGFTISHDYGSQRSHGEPPHDDVHYGASNADHASIAVLQLGSTDFGGPSIDIGQKSESIGGGKSEGLDGYIGKEIYGSYMEYDKLVKDGKKGPSVYPREYYESDGHVGKEKYESDDRYGGSNNAGDKGRYLESENYDGSEDCNENENYGALRGNVDYLDDGETDKYVIFPEYGELDDPNAKRSAGLQLERYGDSEYNDDKYWPSKTNYQITNRNENYEAPSTYVGYDDYSTEPTFENIRDSILDDFFKEYNEFAKGANIQSGFKHDHEYDHDYHGDHDFHDDHAHDDEHSSYAEDGENEKNFFDDADSHGDYHEQGNGEENSHFGEKKGHKKGSKTTGFRNVLHKDEYTKDHTFYEHAKNAGHFDKAGDYGEHEYQDEASHAKSGHHDSSSHEDHHGISDSEDKGHSIGDDLSHHDDHGYKTYFDDNSDYSNGEDSRYGSKYEDSYGVGNSEPSY